MRPYLYILNGHSPLPVENALEWARWLQKADRIVARTEVAPGIDVSTVFLGLDHGYSWMDRQPGYKPLLFETMVFGGQMDQYQKRYATWVGAEAGHAKIVQQVKEGLAKQS